MKRTVFLRLPDGELQPTIELRKELTRLIREHKPDVVLAGNPEAWFYGNEYVNHPDHRAAAQAACEAVFPSAGTRLIFTDLLKAGYEPHNVKRLYVHGTEKPDTWVDISGTIDVKVKALQQHASQVPVDEVEKWMKDWAKARKPPPLSWRRSRPRLSRPSWLSLAPSRFQAKSRLTPRNKCCSC